MSATSAIDKFRVSADFKPGPLTKEEKDLCSKLSLEGKLKVVKEELTLGEVFRRIEARDKKINDELRPAILPPQMGLDRYNRKKCPICLANWENELYELTDGSDGRQHHHAYLAHGIVRRWGNGDPSLYKIDIPYDWAAQFLNTYTCENDGVIAAAEKCHERDRRVEELRKKIASDMPTGLVYVPDSICSPVFPVFDMSKLPKE